MKEARMVRAVHVWAVVGLLAVLFSVLIGLVLMQSYQGRVFMREGQLRGCERSKLDRVSNARGWRAAERARRASGTANDLRAAELYAQIAADLEARSAIDCQVAFPPARVTGK